jgi:hypothetical protein
MRTAARSLAVAAGVLLAGTAAVAAETAAPCSHDAWTIDGTAVTATVCARTDGAHVAVETTLAAGTRTIARTTDLEIVTGADVTRAIDTIPLDAFGSPKSLHVTILYRAGRASIEHAQLLPGAVVLE